MNHAFFTTEISDPRFESQGIRHITVKSKNLPGRGDVSVYVPKGMEAERNLPIVTLLHGVYGSHWAWSMKAGVHLTLQAMIEAGEVQPMVLAMPSDALFEDGSGYLPHHNANYEAWIVEDVPAALIQLIPQVSGSSVQFISGLSMGGYGALRLGAKYPTQYKAFSGLSSITRFEEIESFYEPGRFQSLQQAVVRQESVLEVLLRNRHHIGPFHFDCGLTDPLIAANRELHRALDEYGIIHSYQENPGKHEWSYWEKYIRDSFLFFRENMRIVNS